MHYKLKLLTLDKVNMFERCHYQCTLGQEAEHIANSKGLVQTIDCIKHPEVSEDFKVF